MAIEHSFFSDLREEGRAFPQPGMAPGSGAVQRSHQNDFFIRKDLQVFEQAFELAFGVQLLEGLFIEWR